MSSAIRTRAWERWVSYWFRPGPVLDLAVVRIATVGFQLFMIAGVGYLDILRSHTELPVALWNPPYYLKLLCLPFDGPPPFEVVAGVYWISIVSGAMALIGLSTRISLWVFALTSLFSQSFIYAFGELHHPQAAMHIVLFFLAASPSGAALSLDDLWRRIRTNATRRHFEPYDVASETSPFATWPLQLVWWLFSLIYLSAALSKLLWGSGAPWLNGYTLQYYMIQDGLRWNVPLALWIGEIHWLALVGSWMAVLWEGLFWTVLLYRPLALLFVPMGVGFHTSVYMIQRAPFFAYFALYTAFVPFARCLAWIRERVASARPQRPDLLYDGQCPLCIRSVTVLHYFDWFDRLVYTDLEPPGSLRAGISLEDARREMHLVLPDGEILRGFFAVRGALWKLPVFWPLLPVFYFPLAAEVGPWVYSRVASTRARFESCDSDSCALHRT